LIIESNMIIWVDPEPSVGCYQRCAVISFDLAGNCLFLDSQKRQYNIVGWPYIGPVVKDSEMQVRCVAECICLEESHCMYVWIVRMLADMEPRCNLSFLDLIFGDQGLTQKIMVDLDIATTCIIRCDYYHQIHEVWTRHFRNSSVSKNQGSFGQNIVGDKGRMGAFILIRQNLSSL
jgi:hypothetical protein